MRKLLYVAVIAGLVIAGFAQSPRLYFSKDYPQQIARFPIQQQASIVAEGVLTVNEKVNKLHTQTGDRFLKAETRLSDVEKKSQAAADYIVVLEDLKVRDRLGIVEDQLKDFRAVMCPLIKDSKLNDKQKNQVEKVCPKDSDTQK